MTKPIENPLNRNNLSHGISALLKKKSKLLGEIKTFQERTRALEADIRVLDRAMRILEPETSEEALRVEPVQKRQRTFKNGELKRAILSELRQSDKPMTIRELAEAIQAKKGIKKRITDSVKHSAVIMQRERLIELCGRHDTYEKAFVIA